MCTYGVANGGHEIAKQKQSTCTDELDNTGGESKEKFQLNQCPAYVPVNR